MANPHTESTLSKTNPLNALLNQSRVWRGKAVSQPGTAVHSSGYPGMDDLLPGGGWPAGGVVEVITASFGIGEVRLLVPLMRSLSQERKQWILWVAPPFQPYAPALAQLGIHIDRIVVVQTQDPKEQLWAMEQALKSQACSLVLGWPGKMTAPNIRRLQLQATQHQSLCFLFCPSEQLQQPSPVSIKMHVQAGVQATRPTSPVSVSPTRTDCVSVQLLKRRGSWAMHHPALIQLAPYHLLFSEGIAQTATALDDTQPEERVPENVITGPW